jgi:hypothetical protein
VITLEIAMAEHTDSPASGRPRTVRDEINAVRRAYPNKKGVELWAGAKVAGAKFATLWFVIKERDTANVQLHKSFFEKHQPQSTAWWRDYFADTVFSGGRGGVLENSIMPGIKVRMGGQIGGSVFVYAVIGYALHKSMPPSVLTRRD